MLLLSIALAENPLVPGYTPPATAVDLHRPSVDGRDTVLVADARPPASFTARAQLHLVHAPLVWSSPLTEPVYIVRDALALDLGVSWGVGPVSIGALAPVYLWTRSDLEGMGGAALGDPGLALRGVLPVPGPVGVAVLVRGGLPLGASALSLGESRAWWEAGVAVDFEAGPLRLAGNLLHRGRGAVAVDARELDDALAWGLAVSTGERWGVTGELTGQLVYADLAAPTRQPAELLVSGWNRGPERVLRVGAGVGVNKGLGAPQWRLILGTGQDWEAAL